MATAADLIANVQSFITPDAVQRLATLVGETPAVTQRAMKDAVPTMLGGILNLGSHPGGISQLQGLLTTDARLPTNLGSILESDALGLRRMGQVILGSLFGGKLDSVVESVASSAGAKPSAVSSLLTLAAPFIMSILGRQVRSQGLNAGKLLNVLATHKEAITNLLPPSLASALTLPDVRVQDTRAVADRVANTARTVTAAPARASGLPNWWPWAVALALLALLGAWYMAG